MKLLRASTAGLVAGLLMQATVSAQTFTYTGTITNWFVPTSGLYQIEAWGAQGGQGNYSGDVTVGGRGAYLRGSFALTGGDFLQIAVGGAGSGNDGSANGGGGGGSFVVDMFNSALLVAGGGGGNRTGACQNGSDASITAYGKHGSGGSCVSPGTTKNNDLGLGGIVTAGTWGGGGAGFFGDGTVDDAGTPGMSWANGLAGGSGSVGYPCFSTGGFGGGGNGTGCGGGGGGGGYSGGDGGWIAGGGGSWNVGFDQYAEEGLGYGNGMIRITQLDGTVTPEPVTMTLLGTGLAGIAAARKRRRNKTDA